MKDLKKKLKGYQKHNRNRHLLAKELLLSDQEFRLWDLAVTLCGWDQANPDSYLLFEGTMDSLAAIFNWSKAKVSRTMDGLIKKGIITRNQQKIYKVNIRCEKGSETEDGEFAQKKDNISLVKNTVSSLKQNVAPVRQKEAQSHTNPLISFKGDLVSFRSDEEYQKLLEEGQYTALTIDDMRWIDQNVSY